MKNNGTPAIRFKGYTDVWEQRKLGDLFISLQNNTLSRADLCLDGGVAKNVHYGDVLIKFGECLDVEKEELPMISNDAFIIKYKNSFLKNGDVIVADTAEDETVGKCCEIAGIKNEIVISGLHTIPYRPLSKFASGYLGYYINSDAYHNQLLPLMQGTKVTSISKSPMQDTVISFPKSLDEQGLIASMFVNIDSLITLHQRKLEKLKNTKKSMLEKMFPKNGEKVPEIRFSGFTDDWEQRKFSDIYDKVSEKNDLTYTKEQIISVANMYFKPDSYITDEEYLRTYNVFLIGDIAFEGNKSKNFAHGRFVENTIGSGIVSHVFDVFRPKIDAELLYWKYAINNERLMGSILIRCTKASTMMTNLVATDFLSESILVPSVEEQGKIGTFLDNIDSLITLHQRKLEKLQNIKKSMLEKMFV